MMPAPIQAGTFPRVQVMFAADDERSCKIDGSLAEPCLEFVTLLGVAQLVKPVDDLTVTVIEPRRPLPGGLLALPNEDAFWSSILELDEAERVLHRIANDNVTRKITEELIFPGKPIKAGNACVVKATESGQMAASAEERADVLLFFEDRAAEEF